VIEMVMNGVAPLEVRDEMNANAARHEELKAKLAAADEPPPLPSRDGQDLPREGHRTRESVSGAGQPVGGH
jgi:hypothetical protein